MSISKFLLGFLTLLAALSLQLWLVPFGIHADLAFAALIAYAFIFGIQELTIFVLLAVLILNWQPEFSLDLLAFALIPFLVYAVRNYWHVDALIGSMVSIIGGLLLLYLLTAPTMILSSFASFFLDMILCLVVVQVALWGMKRGA